MNSIEDSQAKMVELAPGVSVVADYGDWLAEYRAVRDAVALMDRDHRGLIEIRGNDRAPWLHNLLTNEVKNLSPGQGVFAFAVNLKGRTLFDLNLLIDADRFLLDLDRRRLNAAQSHLDRYLVAEDVAITDRTAEFSRIGVLGTGINALFAELGAPNVPLMADIHHAPLEIHGLPVTAFRHDFSGLPGVELIVARADRERLKISLLDAGRPHGIRQAGWRAAETVRIEQGVPRSVDDIDEEVIPPETLRVEQGISYHKGCYLGQEVIERMRSHGVLARRLVGVAVQGARPPAPGSELIVDDKPQGRVTSTCHSPILDAPLALGYLSSRLADPGREVQIRDADGSLAGRVVVLPIQAG